MTPEPPYDKDKRHPYIDSRIADSGSGYTYCLICGAADRSWSERHIQDTEIAPHDFHVLTGFMHFGWQAPCRHCGYQRVHMKHPRERPTLCGAQINLDFNRGDEGGPLYPVLCDVDVERVPKHVHHAYVHALTVDAHAQHAELTWRHS